MFGIGLALLLPLLVAAFGIVNSGLSIVANIVTVITPLATGIVQAIVEAAKYWLQGLAVVATDLRAIVFVLGCVLSAYLWTAHHERVIYKTEIKREIVHVQAQCAARRNVVKKQSYQW